MKQCDEVRARNTVWSDSMQGELCLNNVGFTSRFRTSDLNVKTNRVEGMCVRMNVTVGCYD